MSVRELRYRERKVGCHRVCVTRVIGAISNHTGAHLRDEITESAQRVEVAVGKEIVVMGHAVIRRLGVTGIVRQLRVWKVGRSVNLECALMLGAWSEIRAPTLPFGDDGHELRTHVTTFSLRPDVGKRNGCFTDNADCPSAANSSRYGRALSAMADLEANTFRGRIGNGTNPGFLALSPPKPEAVDERHCRSACWIRTGDGPRPEPGDNGCRLPVRESGLRVQVPDPAHCLIPYPLPVVADILG